MTVSLIIARAHNGVMGDDKKSPLWRLPGELQHFRDVTWGHPIIMGRKTYEPIGKPLPGRQNIIITRNKNLAAPGCDIAQSLQAALGLAAEAKEVFIIGGGEIFKQALPQADKLYLTEVDADIAGNIVFDFDESQWNEVSREAQPADSQNEYAYTFVELVKKTTEV